MASRVETVPNDEIRWSPTTSMAASSRLASSDSVDEGTTTGRDTPRKRHAISFTAPLLGAVSASVVLLLLVSSSASGLVVITLTPAYTAGCAGVASGHGIQVNTGGPNTFRFTGPTLATGAASSNATTIGTVPGNASSSIKTKNYFFVGPSPGGCYKPATGTTATANFTWNASWSALSEYAYCGTAWGSVTATISFHATANIHFASAPYYVTSPSPSHTFYTHTITQTCTATGVNTRWTGATSYSVFTVTVGPANLSAGTNYDFYSGIWGEYSVSMPTNGTSDYAYAQGTEGGSFLSMDCNC